MWYFIIIMCAIMLFLLVLALHKFYKIDTLKKEYDDKIDEIKERLFTTEEEKAKLQTFKYIVENYITGARTDKEVRRLIKELLFSTNNNSN
ncbi:MAG: hypothetical protein HFJ52_07685 [Clostridia bacterium]|nr:hypothetical protein [Clostridia bacterium]